MDGLDYRSFYTGPVLCIAHHHGRIDVDPDQAKPRASRSRAGQGDDGSAGGVFNHVFFLPVWPGVVLDDAKYFGHYPAVVYQQNLWAGSCAQVGETIAITTKAATAVALTVTNQRAAESQDRRPVSLLGVINSRNDGYITKQAVTHRTRCFT